MDMKKKMYVAPIMVVTTIHFEESFAAGSAEVTEISTNGESLQDEWEKVTFESDLDW